MPEYTDNFDLQKFAEGESPWSHTPDMETIDDELIIKENRAPDTTEETPKNGAMFLDKSTGDIYLGDGASWGSPVWTLSDGSGGGGGGGASTDVAGIETRGQHVGPVREGDPARTVPGGGNLFWAQGGLSFHSAVVDTDLSDVSTNIMTIELAHYDGGAANPSTVGTIDVEVSGGPERIDISGLPDIPSDGQYVLARPESPNGDVIPARRIDDADFGAARYDEHTYDAIDFLRGTNIVQSGDFGAEGYWYFFYDIVVGDPAARVMSPFSSDVDEIYMRPFDPAEEHDVGPRALWIDTSGG